MYVALDHCALERPNGHVRKPPEISSDIKEDDEDIGTVASDLIIRKPVLAKAAFTGEVMLASFCILAACGM